MYKYLGIYVTNNEQRCIFRYLSYKKKTKLIQEEEEEEEEEGIGPFSLPLEVGALLLSSSSSSSSEVKKLTRYVVFFFTRIYINNMCY